MFSTRAVVLSRCLVLLLWQQMRARQRREEEVEGAAAAQHSEKLRRHLARQKELDAAAQARARLDANNKNGAREKQEL